MAKKEFISSSSSSSASITRSGAFEFEDTREVGGGGTTQLLSLVVSFRCTSKGYQARVGTVDHDFHMLIRLK
ncbi:hypothetical protein KY289_029438 [Solanum tuberosum]|nr:hypothetical protein KY289_029438 [Solanum tuberosum]